MLFSKAVLLSLLSCFVSAQLTPVTSKGNAFWVGDTRFYIRGVDYQPGGLSNLVDPIASKETLARDIKNFKDLGVNTIRVYSVDNTADHDETMKMLDDAGIYVVVDVNIPKASISRADAKCSYNTLYLTEVFATVAKFAKYPNTLGFFAANEVINDDKTTATATYVKAVVRDMKLFMKGNNLRQVPTGYSAADVAENRLESALYFNCGDDANARLDMYAFNDYSWCGKGSSFTVSGYDEKVKAYSNYSIPLFLSEFGCNTDRPRAFTEIELIYSTQMSSVFSGGMVYEYSEESNKYGLVEIGSDGSASPNDDFKNLKAEYAKAKNPTGDGGARADYAYSTCPAISKSWKASPDLPDTPKGALKFIEGKLKPTGKGFKGDTQWGCKDPGNDDASGSSGNTPGTSSNGSSSKGGSSSSAKLSKKSGASSAYEGGFVEGFVWIVMASIMAALA